MLAHEFDHLLMYFFGGEDWREEPYLNFGVDPTDGRYPAPSEYTIPPDLRKDFIHARSDFMLSLHHQQLFWANFPMIRKPQLRFALDGWNI